MRPTLVTLASIIAIANAEIALYWGQNAVGGQDTLKHYCENSPSDIVLLSFLYQYPNSQLNFANQCGETFSDGLLHCPQIGEDITACQAMGKEILLTLGGAVGPYGFSRDSEAEKYAHTLNDMFGPVNPLSGVNRPFDNAVIDGYNLDAEDGTALPNAALARELKSISPATKLAAAPQCVYPDQFVGDALENASFDYVFVQFYNNYCNLDKDFNWNTWSDYAKNVSPNKNVKIFVGLPGDAASAGTGYVTADYVKSKMSIFENDPAFGGYAIWDASSSEANSNYAKQLIELGSNPELVSSSSASTVDPVTIKPTSTIAAPVPSVAPTSVSTVALVTSEMSSTTAAPVPSVAPPSALYGNSSISLTSLSSTFIANEYITHETVITITKCDDSVCTDQPVTTSYVLITINETEFTTHYLPKEDARYTYPAAMSIASLAASASTTETVSETIFPTDAVLDVDSEVPAPPAPATESASTSAPAPVIFTEAVPSSAPATVAETEGSSSFASTVEAASLFPASTAGASSAFDFETASSSAPATSSGFEAASFSVPATVAVTEAASSSASAYNSVAVSSASTTSSEFEAASSASTTSSEFEATSSSALVIKADAQSTPNSVPAIKADAQSASSSVRTTAAISSTLSSVVSDASKSLLTKVNSNTITTTISTVVYVTAGASSSAITFEAGAHANKLGLGAALLAGVALLL